MRHSSVGFSAGFVGVVLHTSSLSLYCILLYDLLQQLHCIPTCQLLWSYLLGQLPSVSNFCVRKPVGFVSKCVRVILGSHAVVDAVFLCWLAYVDVTRGGEHHVYAQLMIASSPVAPTVYTCVCVHRWGQLTSPPTLNLWTKFLL